MTVASGVPAFMDKLAAIALATFPVSGPVKVNVGPAPPTNESGQALWIGASGQVFGAGQMLEAASSSQDWADAEYTLRVEPMVVHCIANAWHGSENFTLIRDQCYAQMDAFAAAVLADHTLGGTVSSVQSAGSNLTLSWMVRDNGTTARLGFDVTATTFLSN